MDVKIYEGWKRDKFIHEERFEDKINITAMLQGLAAETYDQLIRASLAS